MPQRNGNKRAASPRPEVKKALRTVEQGRRAAIEATESIELLVREHPVASIVVAALAGLGAALFFKALLR